MYAIIALPEKAAIEYDSTTKKAYIKLDFYGAYSSLCSIFTVDASNIEKAKDKGALHGQSFVSDTEGRISQDTVFQF